MIKIENVLTPTRQHERFIKPFRWVMRSKLAYYLFLFVCVHRLHFFALINNMLLTRSQRKNYMQFWILKYCVIHAPTCVYAIIRGKKSTTKGSQKSVISPVSGLYSVTFHRLSLSAHLLSLFVVVNWWLKTIHCPFFS